MCKAHQQKHKSVWNYPSEKFKNPRGYTLDISNSLFILKIVKVDWKKFLLLWKSFRIFRSEISGFYLKFKLQSGSDLVEDKRNQANNTRWLQRISIRKSRETRASSFFPLATIKNAWFRTLWLPQLDLQSEERRGPFKFKE